MSLTLTLTALPVPAGTDFPATVQEFLELITEYVEVPGSDVFNGVNFGAAQPPAIDRDKPWFKTTEAGVPVGWYSWAGASWDPIPMRVPSGTTEERPADASEGTRFFDTTLHAELIYERNKWRTAFGSPGDVKLIAKPTLAEALTANPGWIQFGAASGRVLGAAGAGIGLTDRAYNAVVGTETHTLLTAELPAHTHGLRSPPGSSADNGDIGSMVVTANSAQNSSQLFDPQTVAVGEDAPHENMQPTLFLWCLVKE